MPGPDDYDVEINEDGALTQSFHEGAEPTEWVAPTVVSDFKLGLLVVDGDTAITLTCGHRGETNAVLAMEPRVVKALFVGLGQVLERL